MAPRRSSDDELLNELLGLADTIGEHEKIVAAAYARRCEVWIELTDRGLPRGTIAAASGVTKSAIGFGLHKHRKGVAAAR